MDSEADVEAGISVAGLSVRPDRSLRIGSLRYFDAAGAFVTTMAAAIGGPMPKALHAVRHATGANGSEVVLAFRSPTETLLLCRDLEQFALLELHAAGRSDGCLVVQTSGLCAWTITGARTRELLTRLGATSAIPALGEARTGRLAELSATTLCVRPGEIILLVERVYSRHLMEWIAATVGDL